MHSPLVGPTSWLPVAQELEGRGREAVVPSLLGLPRAHPPQWRYVPDTVRAATARTEAQIVLVGHSGAGLLLPSIAEALTADVAALIFVDSFLPPARGSVPLAPPGLMQQVGALASDGVLPPWSDWFGEDTMRELVPDESLRTALEQEMPRMPLSYFEASLTVPEGWGARPCGYLLFSREPYAESADDARDRRWPVVEIPGVQHLATVSQPIAVTAALLDLELELLPHDD